MKQDTPKQKSFRQGLRKSTTGKSPPKKKQLVFTVNELDHFMSQLVNVHDLEKAGYTASSSQLTAVQLHIAPFICPCEQLPSFQRSNQCIDLPSIDFLTYRV